MLRLKSDLERKVSTDIIDNRRSLITAGVLRLILQDIIDTVLEPPRYIYLNTFNEFLSFLDTEYQNIINDIQKDPGFTNAFKVRPYGIVIDNDLGVTTTTQTPLGEDVYVSHNSYEERGASIYLVNDQITGTWILLYEVNNRVRYNNPTPMHTAVGGLEVGTVFNYEPLEDLLTGLLYPYRPPILSLTGNVSSQVREVGLPLLSSGESYLFNVAAQNTGNIQGTLTLKGNGQVLTTIEPGQSHSYAPADYDALPNVTYVPTVYTWRLEGVDTRGDVCEVEVIVDWKHRVIVGWAPSKVLDTMELIPISQPLSRPTSVVKPETSVPGYLHIFLPTSYTEFSRYTVAGFDAAIEEPQEVTLTRLGAEVTYRRYVMSFPTYAEFTLLLS